MTPTERRAYAQDLRRHADAYALASNAPGLRKDAARYLQSESLRLTSEAWSNDDYADREERDGPPRHTVRGQTSEDGWAYGVNHDFNCPACVASGSSFTTSPRSETYWSS